MLMTFALPCLPCSGKVFWRGPLCKLQQIARNATCRKTAVPAKGTAPSAKGSTTCVSALTVFTIARIAAKLAMFLWPPAVAIEAKTFRLFIDADARLAAAAGGVVRYLADVAGLENRAAVQLQSAVIAACSEAFEHLTPAHPQLQITFTRFSNRMEVALSHLGEDSPAVGLDKIAGFASQIGGTSSIQAVLAAFDRVQYETHDGEAVTRLTKYIAPGNIDQNPSIT